VFFFQAEDGIRDSSVTGVQTCALPIFERELVRESVGRAAEDRRVAERVQRGEAAQFAGLSNASGVRAATSSFLRLRASRYAGGKIGRASCRERRGAAVKGRVREQSGDE